MAAPTTSSARTVRAAPARSAAGAAHRTTASRRRVGSCRAARPRPRRGESQRAVVPGPAKRRIEFAPRGSDLTSAPPARATPKAVARPRHGRSRRLRQHARRVRAAALATSKNLHTRKASTLHLLTSARTPPTRSARRRVRCPGADARHAAPSHAAGTYIHKTCVTGGDIADAYGGWQASAYSMSATPTPTMPVAVACTRR